MGLNKSKKELQNQIFSLQKENELLRDTAFKIIDGNTKLLESICSKLEIDDIDHQNQIEVELVKQILKPILTHVLVDYDIKSDLIIRKQATICGAVEEKEVKVTFEYKHSARVKDFNIYISEEAFKIMKDLYFEIDGFIFTHLHTSE